MFDGVSCLDKNEDEHVMSHNKENSSCGEGQFFWLDDYKCSLCGIELPSSFVEERQEHFDFHLAEKLQREESSNRPRVHASMQR